MNLNRGNGKAKHTATPNVASPWDRMDSFFFVVLIESNAFDLSFQYENPSCESGAFFSHLSIYSQYIINNIIFFTFTFQKYF